MRELLKPDGKLLKLLPPPEPQDGITYVPSAFLLSFEHGEKKYYFNTLTKQLLETEVPSFATAGGDWDYLIRQRFLVQDGKDECAFYNSISSLIRAANKKKPVPSFVVMTTLRCNARCVYCYEEGLKQTDMSDETAEDTLRFILDKCGDYPINVTWFGGEPLLREEVIDRLSTGFRDAGVRYCSSVSTNGSLITPDTVRKMADLWNTKCVNISMDGAEDDYISRKRYRNYRNFYHTAINAADLISEAGIKVTVRCNVDLENVDETRDLIRDLSDLIQNKSNVAVYHVPLFQVCRSPDVLKVCEKIVELRKDVVSAGFKTVSNEFAERSFRIVHCMADGEGYTVAPDGSLYCCELMAPGSRIGHVREGVTDREAKEKFGCVSVTAKKCRRCAFLPECTSLSTCPKYFDTCKAMRTLLETEELKRTVEAYEAAHCAE